MKKGILLFLILTVLNCKEDEAVIASTCGVDNPLNDIEWLKEIRLNFEISASLSKKKIIQYDYKNQTVFLIDGCVQCPDFITVVYNCDQEVLCEFGGIDGRNTCPDFENEAKNETVLWEN